MSYAVLAPKHETFGQYLQRVADNDYLNEGSWRLGQTYYNCAPRELIVLLQSSSADPFYRDENVPLFLSSLYKLWPEDAR